MIISRLPLFIIIIFFSFTLISQTPSFKKDITGDVGLVKWMEQSADGTIIVGGEYVLAGYDNITGDLKWKNDDMIRAHPDWYVGFEPYAVFTIKYSNPERETIYSLINSATGKKLFSSKGKILFTHLDVERNFLLMEIETKPAHTLVKYDLDKNELAWEAKFHENSRIERVGFGYSIFNTMLQYNDHITIGTKDDLVYAFNTQTGVLLWEKEYKSDIQYSHLILERNQILIQCKNYIDILDGYTGKKINKKEIKTNEKVVDAWKMNEHQLVLPQIEGFNILDLDQGKLILEGVKVRVRPDNVIKVDDNYLTYNHEMIYFQNSKGKTIWANKLSENTRRIEVRNEGILIASPNHANIFSYEKGRKTMDGFNYSSSSVVLFDKKNDKLISFDGRKLQLYDIASDTKKALNEKIKLKNITSGLKSLQMEIRKKGYFVYTDQNVAMFDFNGSEIYNDYYTIVYADLNLGEAYLNMNFGRTLTRLMLDNGKRTTSQKRVYKVGNLLGMDIEYKRLIATHDVKDYIYLFVREGPDPYFKKINKDTGEVEAKILLPDRDPTFILDLYEDIIIFAEEGKRLIGVKL